MRRRAFVSAVSLSSVAMLTDPLFVRAQAALEKIRVASSVSEPIAPLYYAIKMKLFERVGLDVEIVATSSGAAATTAVIAGTYEIAKPTLLAVFSAHLRDVPIVIVAPGFIHTPAHPNSLLQIAADSPLKSGSDLNEKTIGVPSLNDMNSVAVRAWVDKNGGDWKSLKFIETPNSALEEALARHRIDAASLTTPALDASLAAGTTKSIGDALGAIAPIFMADAYVARPDWASQHADAVRRYARVIAEVNGYFNAHLAETAQWVSEVTKIELANVTKMNRSALGTTLDPALVQPLVDAAAKYGGIPHGFRARDVFWSGR
jgi:NitT/TauT family transport system substrate-binding protein